MTETVRSFLKTVEEIETRYPTAYLTLDKAVQQLDRYSRAALTSTAYEKRGSALSGPVDAALKISILLLEAIDSGTTGLDDSLAKELRGTYEKYLGTFKV